MAKYIVQMVDANTDEVLETLDEVFKTEEEAEEYALEYSSDFSAGADVLEDAGRDFIDPDDVEFIVVEK